MPGPPRRYGMLAPPAPEVSLDRTPSFRDVGFLVERPELNAQPFGTQARQYKVPDRQQQLLQLPPGQAGAYSPPESLVVLFRRQAVPMTVPQQYGSDTVSLGHYAPFTTGIPIRSTDPFVEMSGFQPWSRGGHVLVSLTEVQREGGPAAAARRFANTRFGLWFKSWYQSPVRTPLGSVQGPSPQFRGVMPNYTYTTLPRVIGGG